MNILDALHTIGLVIDNVVLDGTIQRVPTIDHKHKKNGWYVGRVLSGKEYCTYGRWDTGDTHKYTPNNGKISTQDQKSLQLLANLVRQEKKQLQRKAAIKAKKMVLETDLVHSPRHPYIMSKKIKGEVLCLNNFLIIPVFNAVGEIVNIQKIDAIGNKKFLYGGEVKGCYGKINGRTDTIYICEGWATAATIHQATGSQVIIAFNTGNLESVCLHLQRLSYSSNIIICADNDYQRKDGNIGVETAQKISQKTGIKVLIPTGQGTDFNDMAAEFGLDAVRKSLDCCGQLVTNKNITDTNIDITLCLPENIIDPGGLISSGMQACRDSGTEIIQYSFPLVLSVIANAISGKIKYGQVWPNLYNIKVGGTSTGKTDSDKAIKTAIKLVNIPKFYGPTDFSSGPGLLRGLVDYPQCLINLDEITSLFKRFDKPDVVSAGKISSLLELHTNAGQEILKTYGDSKNTIYIDSPCVNIIGNATPIIFDDLRPEDFESGLIQRFDFWTYAGKIPYRKIKDKENTNLIDFVSKIKKITEYNPHQSELQSILGVPADVTLSVDCKKMLDQYSVKIIDEANSQKDNGSTGIVSRKYYAAIKYALIHMISAGEWQKMNTDNLAWGIQLADILAAWKLNILAQKTYQGGFHKDCEVFKEAILAAVKAGRRPTGAVIAQRKKRIKQLRPREFDDIVKALAARREIVVDESKNTKAYFLLTNQEI